MKKITKTKNVLLALILSLACFYTSSAQMDSLFVGLFDTIVLNDDGTGFLVQDGDTIFFGDDFVVIDGDTSDYWSYSDTIDWYDWNDTIDWDDWYADCDTIVITSWDDFDSIFDSLDWYNCYHFEYSDSLDWDDYWDDWYTDCDTIFIESFDDFENLDTLDWYDCYIYVYSDSLDWDQYWDDWYADCDTIFIESYNDWNYLDTIDWSECYHFEFSDDYWEWPYDTTEWNNDCDTILITEFDQIDALDTLDWTYNCYHIVYSDSLDWDDYWDDWYADCDTMLIETVQDLLDLEYDYGYDDSIECYIFIYADDFDWDAYLDSLFTIDSLYWDDYGYWNGEEGDCGFDGYIETNSDDYYDYSDATVTVLDAYGAVVAIINANEDGTFDFSGLAPGDYSVVVNFGGLEFELGNVSFDGTGEFHNGLVIEEREQDVTNIETSTIEANLFNIYPNPTVDLLNVNVANTNDATIVIQNSQGKIMTYISSVETNLNRINVKHFANGTYTVSVINGKSKTTKSFVKIR